VIQLWCVRTPCAAEYLGMTHLYWNKLPNHRETRVNDMPEDSAPKKPKKLTLGEFVETNQRLLSVLGIFAALTVFGGNLPEPLIGQMLSFSCLSITILIAIEVWRRLPMDFYDLDKLSNQAELSVVFFWLFLFISTFILIVNGYLAFLKFQNH